MVKIVSEKDVSIRLNEDFIIRLDKIAAMVDLSRRKVMKNLLEVGVEEVEELQNGIFLTSIVVRDLREKLSGGQTTADMVGGDVPVPVRIKEEFLIKLEKLAEREGLSRQQLMQIMLLYSVEQTERMAKIGVVKLFVIIRDLPKYLRGVFKDGEEAKTALKEAGLI